MKDSTRQHIRNGLFSGFGAVVGFLTLMVLVYGLMKLRYPQTDESLLTFLKPFPPRAVGIGALVIAISILFLTLNRWMKLLSGLFGYAVFGAMLAVAAGGFHSRIPALSLTRIQCAEMAGLYALCAFLTYRYREGRTNVPDRIAALCSPILLMYGAISNEATTGFKVLAAMVTLFASAALYDRLWGGQQLVQR